MTFAHPNDTQKCHFRCFYDGIGEISNDLCGDCELAGRQGFDAIRNEPSLVEARRVAMPLKTSRTDNRTSRR